MFQTIPWCLVPQSEFSKLLQRQHVILTICRATPSGENLADRAGAFCSMICANGSPESQTDLWGSGSPSLFFVTLLPQPIHGDHTRARITGKRPLGKEWQQWKQLNPPSSCPEHLWISHNFITYLHTLAVFDVHHVDAIFRTRGGSAQQVLLGKIHTGHQAREEVLENLAVGPGSRASHPCGHILWLCREPPNIEGLIHQIAIYTDIYIYMIYVFLYIYIYVCICVCYYVISSHIKSYHIISYYIILFYFILFIRPWSCHNFTHYMDTRDMNEDSKRMSFTCLTQAAVSTFRCSEFSHQDSTYGWHAIFKSTEPTSTYTMFAQCLEMPLFYKCYMIFTQKPNWPKLAQTISLEDSPSPCSPCRYLLILRIKDTEPFVCRATGHPAAIVAETYRNHPATVLVFGHLEKALHCGPVEKVPKSSRN